MSLLSLLPISVRCPASPPPGRKDSGRRGPEAAAGVVDALFTSDEERSTGRR